MDRQFGTFAFEEGPQTATLPRPAGAWLFPNDAGENPPPAPPRMMLGPVVACIRDDFGGSPVTKMGHWAPSGSLPGVTGTAGSSSLPASSARCTFSP